MYQFRILSRVEDMSACYQVAKQTGHLSSQKHYEELLSEMICNNYKQMAAFEGEKCIAVSGFWINTKLYCGKYVELDNVIIDENYRNKGLGELLCKEIEKEALNQGCRTAVLDCYVYNSRAQKFYFRLDYEIIGYHFSKKLN